MEYTAGNRGEGVRSDCFVNLVIGSNPGVNVKLKSKVRSLYGESILDLCRDILLFFKLGNVTVEIDDQGALPFTIAARLEAAIKKHISTSKEYLLPMLPQNMYSITKDADRITRLYLPGNNPKLMINAGIYGSHSIILDLEDSVAPDKKYEARFLVRNALRSIDFCGAERMVRINQLPAGLEDLPYCIPHHVNLILIPKCEQALQVIQTNKRITEILGKENDMIFLMPIIETAAGVLNARDIALASDNTAALAIGLEDYTADIGVQRTPEGKESFFARCMVVNAARAAGIQPIDSVFSDIDDMEALACCARESKALGFSGMGCIHPRQVPVIHENYHPGAPEIEKAKRIVSAFEKAKKEGSGVVALDSKMIDLPVVNRALKTIEQAVRADILPKNWRNSHEQ